MNETEKFTELHERALSSGDVANMKAADMVLRKAIERLSQYSEDDVAELRDMYEGAMNYDNFVTEKEAKMLCARGAKWDPDTFFDAVNSFGMQEEMKPNYNKWAFYVTANKIAEDQAEVISKWTTDKNQFAQMAFDLAIGQLTDKDRPKFVRWYFGLK